MVALYDFSTLNTVTNGFHRYGKGEYGGNDTCWYDGNSGTCDSSFDDLARQQWKVPFGYGTIYGDAIACVSCPSEYTCSG